jgi:N-methylhydantoinase B
MLPVDTDPIATEVFRHLFISVAEEMGVVLERTAYSPNIKERRDHSCALFDATGALIAQAAHIPVHLGAFPVLMRRIAPSFDWQPGDQVICNDPFLGGTHLPDLSMITPVFADGRLFGFVANRAHHADIGGSSPGSMAPATELYQEGMIVPPLRLAHAGRPNEALLELLCRNVRTPEERRGDLAAQLAANQTGAARFGELLDHYGTEEVRRRIAAARARSERAVRALLKTLPEGDYPFTDLLDGDGFGAKSLPIQITSHVRDGQIRFDFAGTAPQQRGGVNAPLAVTLSAAYYVVLCLLGEELELNEGCFGPIEVVAPPGCLVNAQPPAAVAAGNVETSQRIVDTLLGSLAPALPERIPAASQGTMNNLIVGGIHPQTGRAFTYYETIGGGTGGSPLAPGIDGVHCHMSNTRNTPAEAVEYHYPLRVRAYHCRDGSGGRGRHPGGEGIVRELELLTEAQVTLIADRRRHAPWGLAGGENGMPGRHQVERAGGVEEVDGKVTLRLAPGDRVRVETPGGGGWGPSDAA